MSGHSKWAGIKHKKAIVDAKRAVSFTKVAREVTIAAKEGGGSPDGNFRLRLAIQKAREVNMPADKIKGAIDRGTGAAAGDSLEELRYEGYGPSGVAVLVDAVTDNRNRTSASLKHLFAKNGGNLGETNSVAYLFERKGVIEVDAAGKDPDELGLAAIEVGAEDVSVEGDSVEVTTGPSEFEAVRAALEAAGARIENAEITMHPKSSVPVGEDKAPSVLRLMEALEEDDDVQQVYANFDIPADVLERVSANV
ncbi:MAG TPA: YebC/PmpR family DNA-binding transcriptional regulator [Candidatus Dormibacteraeota bacterium]|nr:YebC/PmpR family DNA-binding transcriptional regulator [Candidatus Dormibacteraeota bacterium]